MSKLSEKYVAVLVEKKLLHPIPDRDVYQTLKHLLYTFVAKDNPAKDSNFNRIFDAEFCWNSGTSGYVVVLVTAHSTIRLTVVLSVNGLSMY